MKDLIERVELIGLKADVQLENETLTIEVWRPRTDVHKSDMRYGKRAWSRKFTDAASLEAWLSGYERAQFDRDVDEQGAV